MSDALGAVSNQSGPVFAQDDRLERYLRTGLDAVEGWLDPFSARFVAAISGIQRQAGWRGSSGEIGIHHGKLFLVLRLATDEPCFAIDVFEQQHLNKDDSGYGDRQAFLTNLQRWAGSDDGVTIIAKSSLDVTAPEIVGPCGRVRLLSIDGGHTDECVSSDLRLAEQVLQPFGVAIADDYFNPSWPAVSVGVARHCLDPDTWLRPFAISPNKLYLARIEHAAIYRNGLRKLHGGHFRKEAEMFGARVDVYGDTGSAVRQMAGSIRTRYPRLWRGLRRCRAMLKG